MSTAAGQRPWTFIWNPANPGVLRYFSAVLTTLISGARRRAMVRCLPRVNQTEPTAITGCGAATATVAESLRTCHHLIARSSSRIADVAPSYSYAFVRIFR